MKKLSILVVLVTLLTACGGQKQAGTSQKLNWLNDMNQALSVARNEKRLVIAEISTEWCPYCQFVEEKIFADPQVAEKLKDFVLVRFDGDKSATQPLMDKWNVTGFPTFIVFDFKGLEIKRFNDINSPAELFTLLDLKAKPDPEVELLEKLNKFSRDDVKNLIQKYSDSIWLPDYYKKLADLYSLNSIKETYLGLAKGLIEERLNNISSIDKKIARITIDQHVDLLADIYKELKDFPAVEKTYAKGAEICEKMVINEGGIANNRNLLSQTVWFYTNSHQLDLAVKFLDGAIKDLPDFWPAYSNFAKIMLAKKNLKSANEYARKAYEMASVVAKPKISFIMAEISATDKNYVSAISVLENAKNDLLKTQSSHSGRSGKILKQIDEKIEEYKSL